MDLLFNLLLILMIYPLNNFIKLKNLIPNQTGEKHQSFASKENVPLSGFFYYTIFIFYYERSMRYFNLIYFHKINL